jgi:pimeloyl-ACP methyl ester carboxylesterase
MALRLISHRQANFGAMKQSTSIVFITGAFFSNSCWDEWQLYFNRSGYTCIAPAWPNKNLSSEDLRNLHPSVLIASNGLATLADYYASIVHSLPPKPILIGHSLGGFIVQLLMQRGMAAAGVAIHSFPPPAVSWFNFSFLKSSLDLMDFFSPAGESYMISFKKWKRAIANGMHCDQQKQSYYDYAVPESKLVIRDSFRCKEKINFYEPHAPLLFTSGSQDKFMPNSLNFKNFKKYRHAESITRYKEFKGHNHLVFGETTWIHEAEFILNWLEDIKH